MAGLEVGVIGPLAEAERAVLGADYEVRAFCPEFSVPEDPVTGSLNAGLALWLTRAGHLPPDYVVRQGTAMGRDGRVVVSTDGLGQVWVGGACHALVEGSLAL
jgi:PhzF family phenazine biosynthesis protein